MKALLFVLLVSACVNAAETKPAPKAKVSPKIKAEAAKILENKEPDCDEKAKKPVEIKPESISLTGNAGCSLDEINQK